MCLLIVLTAVDADYPIVVASNRDEFRERRAAPPGLFVGERFRMLSPRDRQAGGTWIATNHAGMFAGLTNLDDGEPVTDAPTRGGLPHLALDQDGLDAAVNAVGEVAARERYNGFQLALSDGRRAVVISHANGRIDTFETVEPVVITNRHRPGELALPGLAAALSTELDLDARFAVLRRVLLDQGDESGHRVLKLGGDYGTVSSSLIAIRPGAPRELVWRYAPGSPDTTEYRDYSNLSRRLVEA